LRSVEELIESERFAYKVLNASLNGLYVHDVNLGKNVFVNSRYTALTGYTDADLEAMDKTRFFELFHPDDRRRVAEHMQKIVGSGEEMLEIEYRFKTKDDRWIWCLSRDSVFNRDEDGSVCQFIGTFLDITDRKEVEEALRKRESLYRELVQSVNSAIVRYKKDGTITFLNEYAQSLFGYHYTEVIGKPVSLLVPEKDSTGYDLTALVQDVVDHPERYISHINENVCRDGRRVWMAWTNRPLFDKNGRLSEILSVGTDITSHKQAEEGLRQSEILYRSLAANLPNGAAFVVDHELRYVLAEGQALSDAGITPEGLEGKTIREALEPQLAALYEPYYRSALDGKTFRFEHFSHGRHYASHGTPLLDAEGNVYAALAVSYDITERKRSEEALLEINQELTEYAYALTHNLKAPLRAIHNYVEFLSEDLAQILEGEPKKYLEGIKGALRQSSKQFEDLETLYRIKNHVVRLESFDMRELLDEIQTVFKDASDRQLMVAPHWPVFRGEKFLLRQMMVNLIGNGFKFNRSAVKRVEVGWQPGTEDGVEIFIRDNGIGIADRQREQIFRIFKRLHTDREYEGTGIGLAIVRRAARKINCTLRVESTLGQGSTFYIGLPASMVETVDRG
jgi:PAS domain S-box-containing protein